MVLLQSYMYFGTSENPVIYIFNKTSVDFISSYRPNDGVVGGITDMAMFARDVQPEATSKLAIVYTGSTKCDIIDVMITYSIVYRF